MTVNYLPLLVLLLVIAALMRDDFALTLIYLFVGSFALGSWWSRTSLRQIDHRRQFNARAFLGEKVDINLHVVNRGWLPVLWMNARDGLPVALSSSPNFQQVVSLGPHAEAHFNYSVNAIKRGYYPIGPFFVSTGDILGLNRPLRQESQVQYLTVYPKIIPLLSMKIPPRSPQGTLRHTQPIFEDPTRVAGKREYVAGDSLRRVDWKSSASTGRMQVKLFEPSIALETLVFLDLNAEGYHFKNRIDSTELAVVIAASVAAWVAGKQQTVGLRVNGKDPVQADGLPQYIPPRKGQAHLMRMLETLARVELTQDSAISTLVKQQRYQLSWGTTLIVITGQADDNLLHELYQARRSGQNALLILAGRVPFSKDISYRAGHFGIPVVALPTEHSLDIWRK
jgi:uncharacterized protein (DUF58 family)